MYKLIALLAGALFWAQVDAFNFLVLHPLHSGSHEVQLRYLSGALAARGHQITYLKFKNFVQLPPPQHDNITFITLAVDNSLGDVPFITPEKEGRFMLPLDVMWRNGLSPWGVPLDAFWTMPPYCDTLLSDKGLRRRLRRSHFDVALVDLFTNECGLALAHSLGLPSVAYWALPMNGGEATFSSGISNPSGAVPSFMTSFTDRMNFVRRGVNLFYATMNYLVMQFQFFLTDRSIQKHLPGAPSSQQLIANLSGLLENTDFSVDYPREYPPNVINVGCMQCREIQPLPMDLEKFMSESGEAGVILFSMGATFDASIAPPELLQKMLTAFSRLRQRVIMKISGALPKKLAIPVNVRIERWLPQQDVLGHPKTRVFFTHCGLHGAMETIWHGVPAVTLPVYGDQADVSNLLVERGVAVRVYKESSAEQILAALKMVLENPSFSRRAAELQRLMRDQVSSPLDRAIWFVEHVARTKGAEHLKLASRTLSSVQTHNVDVVVAAVLLLAALLRWRNAIVRLLGQGVRACGRRALSSRVLVDKKSR
ncbi:UDP-glucuronosyltransferase 2C1-like [Neocloeon triangulifer]|uniref:UDP-glucuronosyltransferase 2C1-like n=1 Tax=Neocloeon triangulifer TaxID=2078957 RepID=UPI00286ED69C|nr:UDP-glucuronosyltransferase 2C1-like [Neocloeon triangulifer]